MDNKGVINEVVELARDILEHREGIVAASRKMTSLQARYEFLANRPEFDIFRVVDSDSDHIVLTPDVPLSPQRAKDNEADLKSIEEFYSDLVEDQCRLFVNGQLESFE